MLNRNAIFLNSLFYQYIFHLPFLIQSFPQWFLFFHYNFFHELEILRFQYLEILRKINSYINLNYLILHKIVLFLKLLI